MTGTLRASFDVAAVRARFSSLRAFAFLDAPGGSQVPDEVGDVDRLLEALEAVRR